MDREKKFLKWKKDYYFFLLFFNHCFLSIKKRQCENEDNFERKKKSISLPECLKDSHFAHISIFNYYALLMMKVNPFFCSPYVKWWIFIQFFNLCSIKHCFFSFWYKLLNHLYLKGNELKVSILSLFHFSSHQRHTHLVFFNIRETELKPRVFLFWNEIRIWFESGEFTFNFTQSYSWILIKTQLLIISILICATWMCQWKTIEKKKRKGKDQFEWISSFFGCLGRWSSCVYIVFFKLTLTWKGITLFFLVAFHLIILILFFCFILEITDNIVIWQKTNRKPFQRMNKWWISKINNQTSKSNIATGRLLLLLK